LIVLYKCEGGSSGSLDHHTRMANLPPKCETWHNLRQVDDPLDSSVTNKGFFSIY
jgi:hypothetical protein